MSYDPDKLEVGKTYPVSPHDPHMSKIQNIIYEK